MRNRCELTERELEVLRLLSAGYEDAKIADQLLIAVPTVRANISSIFIKLDAQNRTHAANIALRQHLITIDQTPEISIIGS